MRIAMLSPVAWRTPPRHYGPWESVVSLLTEELVARGVEVTLFATGDSLTRAELAAVCATPYEEDPEILPKVWECLHIAEVFERASEFDLIHNHFDFLPLSYSGLVDTPVVMTIHGFSSSKILPVYEKYNSRCHYVAISDADRRPDLDYLATIHHGIDVSQFPPGSGAGDYLLFFGRIHPEKGTARAIEIARRAGLELIIAGIVQDRAYFEREVEPYIDGASVQYVGSVGPERRADLLGRARALVHVIDFDEPFGLSLVEAMACGTPVIANARGSIPELVSDGETGFVVADVHEAVRAVSRVASLDRSEIRRQAQGRFSHVRMADEYLAAYRQVLDARENYRPWGNYLDLVQGEQHKVKELHVEPGQRMSLHRHERRAEHLTVVRGGALLNIDDQVLTLGPGDAIDVPRGAVHRIANPHSAPMVMVEIQLGDYLGEDDVVRIEDD
jgi:glycosyltransferase involved in cell wall biosynthesis